MNILFINNYDSFVYNLVNYFCQLQPDSNIIVEDYNISVDKVKSINPNKIIISPGPGHPKYETGNVIPIIKKFYKKIPKQVNLLKDAQQQSLSVMKTW